LSRIECLRLDIDSAHIRERSELSALFEAHVDSAEEGSSEYPRSGWVRSVLSWWCRETLEQQWAARARAGRFDEIS
jgi:hypothetical protein